MVWRKVQVARPSDSTSGGQWAAARRASSPSPALVIDDDAASAAAVEEAMACAAESLVPLVVPRLAVVVDVGLPAVGGFQFRKEVQILQGLPSGPRTMPGWRERALEGDEDEDCAVGVSVLLVLLLIVALRQRVAVLRHRAVIPAHRRRLT